LKVVVVVAIAILIAASFVAIYLAGLISFGPKQVKLIGMCNSTVYFLPDTEQIIVTNVSSVSNGTTSYYLSTSTSSPTTETINSTTYTTTLITNSSTSYVITNATNLSPGSPSYEVAVSTCTFAP